MIRYGTVSKKRREERKEGVNKETEGVKEGRRRKGNTSGRGLYVNTDNLHSHYNKNGY